MPDLWDITNRVSTKTKLELIEKVFGMWITIWNGPKQQKWIDKEWYIIDLFAGRGFYTDGGKKVLGSFLIFFDIAKRHLNKLNKNKIRLKMFAVEKSRKNYKELIESVENFLKESPELRNIIEYEIICGDCNEKITEILKKVKITEKNPMFILIDPTGLQIKRNTMEVIVRLKNPRDILFNYILEGVRRTSGVAAKLAKGRNVSKKEIKVVQTLKEFLGDDIDIIREKRPEDLEVLNSYVNAVYTNKNLCVVGYNVEYPDRKDDLYYLLFASGNKKIVDIVKDIYVRQKEKIKGPTLFGREFYIESILEICSEGRK